MEQITGCQVELLKDFIDNTDFEWLMRHRSIKFDDRCKAVTVEFDNLNEQEYKWLKIEDK